MYSDLCPSATAPKLHLVASQVAGLSDSPDSAKNEWLSMQNHQNQRNCRKPSPAVGAQLNVHTTCCYVERCWQAIRKSMSVAQLVSPAVKTPEKSVYEAESCTVISRRPHCAWSKDWTGHVCTQRMHFVLSLASTASRIAVICSLFSSHDQQRPDFTALLAGLCPHLFPFSGQLKQTGSPMMPSLWSFLWV